MPVVKISDAEKRRRTASGILRKRMAQAGYNESRLAKRMDVSPSTIYRWMDAPERVPLETIWTLCDVLGVSEIERLALGGGREIERLDELERRREA